MVQVRIGFKERANRIAESEKESGLKAFDLYFNGDRGRSSRGVVGREVITGSSHEVSHYD